MEVLIVSDQEMAEQEDKRIAELLTNVHYMVETNFSRIQSELLKDTYKLVVFITMNDAYPITWNLNNMSINAAIITMTRVDRIDLLIFSSFLKSVGLLSDSKNTTGTKDDLPPILYKSLLYIDENIHENDLSLGKVASNVYISRCHYSRIFKTFFGIGFKEYVINKRIQKAKMMLKEGRTVTDVCYAVGYGDLTHFGRMFKKMVGINPSEYRKMSYKEELSTKKGA